MNNEFEERGYKLIDLNFGFEDVLAKTFEETVRSCNIQRAAVPDVSLPTIEVSMEILARIVHRDYSTFIVEKEIGLNLIPTYCYVRKYFQGSILVPHRDRDSCEISLSYCISGPEWEFNIGGENAITFITKKGNGIIYKGCEVKHGRLRPSSGEVIQVFNHWVISDGTKSNSAYDDGNCEDFYRLGSSS